MQCLNNILITEKRCLVSILLTTVEFTALKKNRNILMNNIYRLSPHETCRHKKGYTFSHIAKRFAKGNYRRRKMGET